MSSFRLATVVGARPQFIKSAPVSRAIVEATKTQRAEISEVLIHTGQHYDLEMSEVFFKGLRLGEPSLHLGIGSGPHGQQTGRMLEAIERSLLDVRPDAVIVYGDTNSTLAASLAAAKLGIPIAHIEAGLRSFNRSMPEEVNRVVADHVATWLLAPSLKAKSNLESEGLGSRCEVVGDVMYDVFQQQQIENQSGPDPLASMGLEKGSFILVTLHRPQNTDDESNLKRIIGALVRIAQEGQRVVLPMHPRTRRAIALAGVATDGLHVLPPVSYATMVALTTRSQAVLTDSGGLQKEAYWAGRPCVTLRPETEWVETVEAGWNVIVDTDPDAIVDAARRASFGAGARDAYGNGKAASLIVEFLINEIEKERDG